MTSFISHTTIDCTDAYALSTWWQGVLGYVEDADDPTVLDLEARAAARYSVRGLKSAPSAYLFLTSAAARPS